MAYPNGKEVLVFSRRTQRGDAGKFITDIEYGPAFGEEGPFVPSVVRKTRENSLALSVAAQENHPVCRIVYDWFQDRISSVNLPGPPERMHSMLTAQLLLEDEEMKKSVLSLMRVVEPGLIDILIKKNDEPSYPEAMKGMLQEEALSIFESSYGYSINFAVKSGKSRILLPYEVQSKGFKKFFSMVARVLFGLRSGDVVIVDELETSIHPHLARMIVELFQNKDVNKAGGQVVFTTHDTNLLDQSLLRRDQIWFVEKVHAKSKLYSLLEFAPRKDENLERGYLRGRYGAIPALGLNLEELHSH
ncbi:hypothetical protein Y590_15809 [Methylobacterium sp. AMS5]|nr:hypothetical protein Y590_15809 [Methylobacterium sp. AMS5]